MKTKYEVSQIELDGDTLYEEKLKTYQEKMNKKYILTDEKTGVHDDHGTLLYRIKAIRDFKDVKVGDLGGFVESEKNLSQDGNSWVFDNAKVFDDAEVYGNAKVTGDAKVYGDEILMS